MAAVIAAETVEVETEMAPVEEISVAVVEEAKEAAVVAVAADVAVARAAVAESMAGWEQRVVEVVAKGAVEI